MICIIIMCDALTYFLFFLLIIISSDFREGNNIKVYDVCCTFYAP